QRAVGPGPHPNHENQANDDADNVRHDVEKRVEAERDFASSASASDHGSITVETVGNKRLPRLATGRRLPFFSQQAGARSRASWESAKARAPRRPRSKNASHPAGPGSEF